MVDLDVVVDQDVVVVLVVKEVRLKPVVEIDHVVLVKVLLELVVQVVVQVVDRVDRVDVAQLEVVRFHLVVDVLERIWLHPSRL